MFIKTFMEKINICGIYKITSPSGKIYIGQSKNIKYRWNQYKYYYEKHTGKSLIHRSIAKYGYTNHNFEIIEYTTDSLLDEKEKYWIGFYKTNLKEHPEGIGMNFTAGGNKPPRQPAGFKMSEEAKKNLSVKIKQRHEEGRYANIPKNRTKVKDKAAFRAEQWQNKLKGTAIKNVLLQLIKIKEKEEKRLIREARRAAPKRRAFFTKEERSLYMSELLKGRPGTMIGYKQSEETKEKKKATIQIPIIQLTLSGEFVKEWVSGMAVKRELKCCVGKLIRCCKGRKPSFKGYKWMYKKDYVALEK